MERTLQTNPNATTSTKLADYWQDRFAPAAEHNAGAGQAMYRRCLNCGGHALEGSLSAHARWCDHDQAHKAAVLTAFDAMESADRRVATNVRNNVRQAARSPL